MVQRPRRNDTSEWRPVPADDSFAREHRGTREDVLRVDGWAADDRADVEVPRVGAGRAGEVGGVRRAPESTELFSPDYGESNPTLVWAKCAETRVGHAHVSTASAAAINSAPVSTP